MSSLSSSSSLASVRGGGGGLHVNVRASARSPPCNWNWNCKLQKKMKLIKPPAPCCYKYNFTFPTTTTTTTRQFPRFSASASISGSASSDYPLPPDELFDGGGALTNQDQKKKRKKNSIAGIDQDELVDPTDLADPDSSFIPFNGLHLHYKIISSHTHTPPTNTTTTHTTDTFPFPFPFVLLHGFGASVFSWNRAMNSLARLTTSKVVAFDRPAFGLTSRLIHPYHAPNINPYSMPFSVLATLFFIKDLLATDKAILIGVSLLLLNTKCVVTLLSVIPWTSINTTCHIPKLSLFSDNLLKNTQKSRHSAGSLVAVDTYFEAPECVAALILVAPAILAPLISSNSVKDGTMKDENQIEDKSSASSFQQNPLIRIATMVSKLSKNIVFSIVGMLKVMKNMVSSLYRKALTAILRSTFAVMILRMVINKFGTAVVKNAWYDANQVTDDVLQGYTKPLKAKGWDRALLEYTAAMLTGSSDESKPPLSKRLSEISCPVLIITGDDDRLVPSWNAERLSRAIPGSHFEVIQKCGHLPHEEKVEEFVSVVQKFLKGVFGASKEQFVHAAT